MIAKQKQAAPRTAWQSPDFRRLWSAQTVSLFGTQLTSLALPLIAAVGLHATPLQMGVLGAAGQLPFLLFSLLTGVWVDRTRRKPLLIWSDLLRAALLFTVPIAAWLHTLGITQLYLVAFLTGTLSVCFEVAQFAYVPSVLPKDHLLDGNARLQVSHSAAEAAGPGLGGVVVQALGAPFALLFDALSFLASAGFIWRIQRPEPPLPARAHAHIGGEIAQGLRGLLGHPLLRPVILSSVPMVLFGAAMSAEYVLYATRTLHLTPGLIGLLAAAGGLGAIPGALLTRGVAARLGVGPAIILGYLLWALTGLAVPLVTGPLGVILAVLAAAQLLGGLADTIANVQQWSLRQIVTPDHLQGRVTASHRFLVYGAGAVGALLGGVLATRLGVREAILVCAIGAILGVLPAACSPLARLRRMPAPQDA